MDTVANLLWVYNCRFNCPNALSINWFTTRLRVHKNWSKNRPLSWLWPQNRSWGKIGLLTDWLNRCPHTHTQLQAHTVIYVWLCMQITQAMVLNLSFDEIEWASKNNYHKPACAVHWVHDVSGLSIFVGNLQLIFFLVVAKSKQYEILGSIRFDSMWNWSQCCVFFSRSTLKNRRSRESFMRSQLNTYIMNG